MKDTVKRDSSKKVGEVIQELVDVFGNDRMGIYMLQRALSRALNPDDHASIVKVDGKLTHEWPRYQAMQHEETEALRGAFVAANKRGIERDRAAGREVIDASGFSHVGEYFETVRGGFAQPLHKASPIPASEVHDAIVWWEVKQASKIVTAVFDDNRARFEKAAESVRTMRFYGNPAARLQLGRVQKMLRVGISERGENPCSSVGHISIGERAYRMARDRFESMVNFVDLKTN